MVVIGVVGNHGAAAVTEIIKEELKNQGNNVWESSALGYRNNTLCFNNMPDYLIVRLNDKRMKKHNIVGKIFDVVVFVNYDNYELPLKQVKDVTEAIKEDGYFIYNSESCDAINFENENIFTVSCGVSSKNTTTISSIDTMLELNFRYCLQKYLLSKQRQVVEPFESNINIKHGDIDVNYYLAAYTCILVLGYKF